MLPTVAMLPPNLRSLLVALGTSLALTIVLTWPLAITTGTARLPFCDSLFSGWVLSWGAHALTSAPATLPDGNIFWPDRDALFYGPAAFGALLWYTPIYVLTGDPVRALNLTYLLCFTLTGATAHWVVWR